MTDEMIEKINADREAGTPGPWSAFTDDTKPHTNVVSPTPSTTCVFYLTNRTKDEPDICRIARVPDMEARILADAEALKAADALAKWAGIAVSRKPNQRTGGRMVLEADLLRIEEALAAYQETRGEWE